MENTFDITNHTKVLSALSAGLDPNTKIEGVTLIDLALIKHATQTVAVLLNHPAFGIETLSFAGYTPFLSAVFNREFKTARILMERGCNVSALTENGRNVIHILSMNCHSETPGIKGLMRKLVGSGAGWLLETEDATKRIFDCLKPMAIRMQERHRRLCTSLLLEVIGVKVLTTIIGGYLFSSKVIQMTSNKSI
jgi:hypothetical protein